MYKIRCVIMALFIQALLHADQPKTLYQFFHIPNSVEPTKSISFKKALGDKELPAELTARIASFIGGSFIQSTSEHTFSAQLVNQENGTEEEFFSVAISPDNSFIVAGCSGDRAKIWNLRTGTVSYILNGPGSGTVVSVAISPNNAFIVTAHKYANGSVSKIWDARTGQFLYTLDGGDPIAISPDNKFVVTVSNVFGNYAAKIWDAETGARRYILAGHQDDIGSVAISSDNTFIVTGSKNRTAKIWDTQTGRCRSTLRGHQRAVTSVAISKNNLFIVTGSWDRTARIWDAQTSGRRYTLSYGDPIGSVTISPDNSFVVAASSANILPNTLKIWNTQTGNFIRSLPGHNGKITSVAISPNNMLILTGSIDRTAKLWNALTGICIDTLTHDRPVSSVAISTDGSFFVTLTSHEVKIWSLVPTKIRRWMNSRMTLSQALLLMLLSTTKEPGKPLSLTLLAAKNDLDFKDLDDVFSSIAGEDKRDIAVRDFFVTYFDLRATRQVAAISSPNHI